MPDACGDCATTVVDCRAFAAGAGDEHDVSAIASARRVPAARPVALMGHRRPIPGFPAILPFPLRATALHLRFPANVIMGQLISPRKTPRLSDAEMARPERIIRPGTGRLRQFVAHPRIGTRSGEAGELEAEQLRLIFTELDGGLVGPQTPAQFQRHGDELAFNRAGQPFIRSCQVSARFCQSSAAGSRKAAKYLGSRNEVISAMRASRKVRTVMDHARCGPEAWAPR